MAPKLRPYFGTIAFGLVLVLVVVGVLTYIVTRPAATRYEALLGTTIGLYPGADVRVLGVPVGLIDEVTPEGTQVRVMFHVNPDTKVPAGVMAAVIAPTVVADRYLQLSPPYTGGPTLPEHAVIPKARTASPAEFDDLLVSADKLTKSLGPQGLNDNGALSQALTTLAKNLDGNGQRLNTTLDNASQAVTTLNGSRDNLFGTIDNLQSFTSNLKDNDGKVRDFTHQFDQVSGYLAGERKDLGQTLEDLSKVLGEVATFVHDNRRGIKVNVDRLGGILGTINGERLSLEQVLDTAPLALDGLVNGFDAGPQTLDTRVNLLQVIICTLFGIPVLGPILMTLLTPILGPENTASCPNNGPPPLPMPVLPTAALSQLAVPAGLAAKARSANPLAGALPNPAGGSPSAPPSAAGTGALGSLPLVGGGTGPTASAPDRDSDDQDRDRKPVRSAPSLGDLFGGGR